MKRARRIVLSILCVVLLLNSFQVFSFSENEAYNKYNIVLVADSSGSMKTSDPEELRFEAISQFVGLLANKGNMVGSVVFNGDIVQKSSKLVEANNMTLKRELVANVMSATPAGYTNIGYALEEAVKLLETGSPKNPSVIILLTDGETDMPTAEEEEVSLTKKADAIQAAREKNIKIYNVCLNADGQAYVNEAKQISSATGGEFREVKTAEDLKEVFNLFYGMIYSTEVVSEEGVFDSNGVFEKRFTVPVVGVEEANIIINGKMTTCQLVSPSGKALSDSEMQSLKFDSKTFTILKLISPEAGEWVFRASGVPGDKIKIDFIYNTNVNIAFSADGLQDNNRFAQKITFRAVIEESDTPIEAEKYAKYNAKLIVSTPEEEKEYAMVSGANGFEYEYEVDRYGSFNVFAVVTGEGYEKITGPISVNVENNVPVAKEDNQKVLYLLPFSDNIKEIDLTPFASDPDGDALSYKVISSAYMDDEYSVSEGTLTMKSYSLSKGSFEIQATDSRGASCTFDLLVVTVNVGILTIILIAVGALITLAVLLLIIYREQITPFYGTIIVNSVEQSPVRGRLALTSFNCGAEGFDGKAYFQAAGRKKAIKFRSKKPVYLAGSSKPVKEVVINNGAYVSIYSDDKFTNSITVSFRSILMR